MVLGHNNQPRTKQKQPAGGGLFRRSRPKKEAPRRKPQVRRHYIALTNRRKLVISVRRFRTRKSQRSKRYKQLVFPVYLLPVKEIAIAGSRWPRTPKRDSHGRFTKKTHLPWLRRQVVIPLVFILIGVSGAVYFGLDLRKPTSLQPVVTNIPARSVQAAGPSTAKTLPRSEPTQLRIAKVGIDAAVLSIGRNADGTIEVPTDYHSTGWYRYSPTPGELGPSIIVGHVDNVHGIAVFWRLRELVPGDIIEVTRADGKIAQFKVTDVKQFPRDSFPTQEVYGNINYAGIRLITCGGTFNTQTHEYSHNTVVYGSLVE